MQKKRQSRKFLYICLAIFSVAIFLLAAPALAQVDVFGGQKTTLGNALGLGEQDPRVTIAKIIRVILGFLGIMAVSLVLYGGFLWMTSEGNEAKIEDAKKVLKNAAIGLAIILASFGIVTFIINALLGASGSGNLSGKAPGSGTGGLTALGNGIIESHYPGRNATEIARNTKIAITFKEAVRPSDLISDTNGSGVFGDCTDPTDLATCDRINSANVWIFIPPADGTNLADRIIDVRASVATGSKTYVFKPLAPLGSASQKIWHSVGLTKNIQKLNGKPAFGGISGGLGYWWSFEVSTFIDDTSPKVESVVPLAGSTEPRNVVIQINFNEAIDPISASGAVLDGFTNIAVNNITAGEIATGTFYISNEYRTVEFITDDACGTNSCGETIYCLPANSLLEPKAKALTALAATDGVVDMADNSLDGDADGNSELSPIDDYLWQFNTNDQILLGAPTIVSISPDRFGSADLNASISATFDRRLMSASLNTTNLALYAVPPSTVESFSTAMDVLGTTAFIKHAELFDENATYGPQFKSGIKDNYQNCYKPCGGLSCSPSTATPSCCNEADISEPSWNTASCP